ncbi:MAG: RNA ligase family protein, partial [Patescibacteria group bacterium]
AVSITEKIHGTNFRCGWVPSVADTWWKKVKKFFGRLESHEFVYGSHNVQLTNKFIRTNGYYEKLGVGNVYAKIVKQYQLQDKLKKGEVLYGEIYGDGIQKNYVYGCKQGEHKLVVFDLMVDGQYCSPAQMTGWCDMVDLTHVPILYWGPFSLEHAKKLTEGNSVLCPTQKVREGVVIKPAEETNHPHLGRKVLKLISDAYLLDKQNTDNH